MRHSKPVRLGNRTYRGGESVYLFLEFTINDANSGKSLSRPRQPILVLNQISFCEVIEKLKNNI